MPIAAFGGVSMYQFITDGLPVSSKKRKERRRKSHRPSLAQAASFVPSEVDLPSAFSYER